MNRRMSTIIAIRIDHISILRKQKKTPRLFYSITYNLLKLVSVTL